MKLHLVIVLLAAFVSLFSGQTLPSPSPDKTKTFGSSLEKYKNKKQRDFQKNRKSKEVNDGEVIQVDTDLVVNNVLVTDQKGKMITNLKKDDFVVTDDGVPQTVEIFSSGENASVPRSIVLIIDYYAAQSPYLENSIQAAKLLVDKLNPTDKMAVVTVDVKLRIDFTQDKNLLKKNLDLFEKNITGDWRNLKRDTLGRTGNFFDRLRKNGTMPGSGLEFESLLAVLNEMFTTEDYRPIIIFQGDGNEIIWLEPDDDAPYPISNSIRNKSGMRYTGKKAMRNFGFSEVRQAIEKSRATIYSVIPGVKFFGFSKKERMARAKISLENFYGTIFGQKEYSPNLISEFQATEAERQTAGQTAMVKVAELSGGDTYFAEKPQDAENIYANIFANVENRYVIGYYLTNQDQSGRLRNVKIEVRDHPKYIITARKTYFLR